MSEIVGIKFRNGCKIYDFDANALDLAMGDTVIVDTEQGTGYARVATPRRSADLHAGDSHNLKKVIRRTTDEDLKQLENNLAMEEKAMSFCQRKIADRDIPMKLVSTEITFDGSRTTFLYTADGRVDFRELVKDLASHLRTRIEMRQIGVRDEARVIGGYGPCGQQLCCTTFIKEFEPVSIKMAKEQDLVLNPAKISGVCGRLMCCLAFEYEGGGGGCGTKGGSKGGGGSPCHGGGGHPCHAPDGAPQASTQAAAPKEKGGAETEEGKSVRKKWRWKRKKKKQGEGGGTSQ